MKVKVQKNSWSPNVNILLTEKPVSGKGFNYATSVIMAHVEEYGAVIEPTFRMSYEEAQELMDDLWTCGLRPSEGSGSAGALAATQKHLEDMRKLVFDAKL